MRQLLIRAGLAGFLLLLTGCATSLRPPYNFNEILVLNKTRMILTEVRIRDVERNRVFECGNVAPNGICSNTFRPRPYVENPIEISWSAGGQVRQSEAFVAKVPDFLDQGQPVRGVLEIGQRGGAEAYFEQDDKGDDR